MSVDTRGLVVTDNKDVFAVCTKVGDALRELLRPPHRVIGSMPSMLNTSAFADFRMSPGLGMVVAEFKYRGEQRMLHIHFSCDCDARAYGEHAIILSLGCWGSSELIMRTALGALADLGPTYIDVNDCDDEDYVEIAA